MAAGRSIGLGKAPKSMAERERETRGDRNFIHKNSKIILFVCFLHSFALSWMDLSLLFPLSLASNAHYCARCRLYWGALYFITTRLDFCSFCSIDELILLSLQYSLKMTEVAEPESTPMPKMELKMMVLPVMFLLQKQIDMKNPEIINNARMGLFTVW